MVSLGCAKNMACRNEVVAQFCIVDIGDPVGFGGRADAANSLAMRARSRAFITRTPDSRLFARPSRSCQG
jgi:hypothetical protein